MWGLNKKKTPEELVRKVERLVSLPEVYFLVKEKLNDPRSDMREVSRIISQDADLTVRLLRLANSAAYGIPQRVETVSRAVPLVGMRQIEALILATTAVEAFARLPAEMVNMAQFWRHSVFAAVISRILARSVNVLHAERLFVAGLVHDIGKLIVYHQLPDIAQEVLERNRLGEDMSAIERELLGFDHAVVGAALARQWDLSQGLQEAIACHHEPAMASEFPLEAAIVHIANLMADAIELKDDEGLHGACDPSAWRLLGLTEGRIKPVFQEALLEFIEILDLLQPGEYRSG